MLYIYNHPRLREVNAVDDDALNEALLEFEGAALKFSYDFIQDARQREIYNSNVQRIKDEVLKQVATGKLSVKEGAEFCYEMRDKIMVQIRKKTSRHGRAIAESRKKVSPSLEKLLNDKSKRLFDKAFDGLSEIQKDSIYYEIIESSARPDTFFNTLNKNLSVMGKVFIVMTVTYSIYEIASADDGVEESARQGITIAMGVGGTMVAGLAISTVCGPGAPVCAIALLVGGGLAGGAIGGCVADMFDAEIEVFSRYWRQ